MDCNSLMNKICDEYEMMSEFSKQFDATCASGDKLKVVNMLIEKYNCGFDEARIVCDHFIDHIPLPSDLSPQEIAHNNKVAEDLFINKPKCPTCGSTNICKIGFGERMLSVGTFGLLSKKMNKTFKCKNCSYTW